MPSNASGRRQCVNALLLLQWKNYIFAKYMHTDILFGDHPISDHIEGKSSHSDTRRREKRIESRDLEYSVFKDSEKKRKRERAPTARLL